MAIHVEDLRASFNNRGWALGGRCIPILDHADAEPVEDFQKQCVGHILYRFYGYDGRLLYIGMTKDLHARCSGKAGHFRKQWWRHAAFVTVNNLFKTREELACAETEAIGLEHPFHNILDAPHMRRHRNGSPGVALWNSSPAVFRIADALWQVRLDDVPRRAIEPEIFPPDYVPPLLDGEGGSDRWAYRPALKAVATTAPEPNKQEVRKPGPLSEAVRASHRFKVLSEQELWQKGILETTSERPVARESA